MPNAIEWQNLLMGRMSKLTVYQISVVLIFLPLSAWLVSFFDNYLIALGRDALLAILSLTIIFWGRKKQELSLYQILAIMFILWGLLSFFWREESLAQWLRGGRFVMEPIFLGLILSLFYKNDTNRSVNQYLVIILGLVIVAGFVEYFFPSVFHTTLKTGFSRGSLEQIHLAGEFKRMQSTLAGPNALGLYLMVSLLLSPLWFKKIPKLVSSTLIILAVIALVLTFSRSAYLGLVFGLLAMLVVFWQEFPKRRIWLASTLLLGVLAISYLFINPPTSLVRQQSNETRLIQYERIWSSRSEIGLLGRGIGSAGLVSQNRLDEGANNYSENTYLDMFEALGIIGALLYLGIWLSVLWTLFGSKLLEAKVIGVTGFGLAIAGIFINHYTGQAAIWTFWLLAGLSQAMLKPNNGEDRA